MFLALSEKAYPRKLAFAYLTDVHKSFVEELQHDFGATWRQQVDTTAKPYAFLRFGPYAPLWTKALLFAALLHRSRT